MPSALVPCTVLVFYFEPVNEKPTDGMDKKCNFNKQKIRVTHASSKLKATTFPAGVKERQLKFRKIFAISISRSSFENCFF